MRLRLGLIIAGIFASLLSPLTPSANAFGGFASAPTSVTQSAIAGGIRVGWSAPVDVDTGITGYRIEYSTSGTSGTWTTWTTVSASTFTSDILGLAQTATYVRVAANTAGGVGAYGYPWATLYSTTALRRDSSGNVTYESGYGLAALTGQASNTYSAASFTRVKYRMETTISSVAKFVETDFYKWSSGGASGSTASTSTSSIAGLAIPSVNAGQQWIVQANVSDLNVYSDNTAVTKTKSTNGRLEIWPWDYTMAVSGLSSAGSASYYDSDDTPNGGGSFGSFQVHDLTNSKPVFSWNNTGNLNSYTAEVGYGANSGNQPDWTFCSQGGTQGSCPAPTSFRLAIYINPAVTPLADATPPTVTRVDSKTLIKSGDTISVQSTEVGTVYLIRNTVTVTNLASITNASANIRASVSISAINTPTTLTATDLIDGTYNLYAVDSVNNVSTGIIGTLSVDATAPLTASAGIVASGDSLTIRCTETVTLTTFNASAYSITDSGSALSITGATVSGLTITLYLSRVVQAGAYVQFSYTPANVPAASRWVDLAGNQLNSIIWGQISNFSTVSVQVNFSPTNSIYKGVQVTLSASVTVAGKVTFTMAGKRIPGCFNRVASGSTPITITCTFKPALSGRQTISVTLVPTLNNYATTTSKADRFIQKRTTTR